MITVYEVQILRDGLWTRWGVYLYEALAQRVLARCTQEGQTAQICAVTID